MGWLASFFDWWRRWLRRIIELLREILGRGSSGGETISDDKCCHLARPDNQCAWRVSKSLFTCPEGYHRQWWYCCEGTQQIACGECTKSADTCWVGPWECSIWWYTGQSC